MKSGFIFMNKIIPLTENHLFSKAYSSGATDVNKLTAVYVLKNYKKDKSGSPFPTRLGITVNKKLGGAVKRNRVKRIVRQAYRECSDNLSDGTIIVVSARGAVFADSVKSGDVARLLKESFERLGLYNGQNFDQRAGRNSGGKNVQNRNGNGNAKRKNLPGGNKKA